MTTRVRVFTHIPSPYQVEFFDAIARSERMALEVCYLHSESSARSWDSPAINHAHTFLNDDPKLYTKVERSLDAFDLVVFNYYRHSHLLGVIKKREQSGKAWCFW